MHRHFASLFVFVALAGCAGQPVSDCPPSRLHSAEYAGRAVREQSYERIEMSAVEARPLIEQIATPVPASLECWYRAGETRLRYERHGEAGGKIYLYNATSNGWRLSREFDYVD